jgi:hypothetical protein
VMVPAYLGETNHAALLVVTHQTCSPTIAPGLALDLPLRHGADINHQCLEPMHAVSSSPWFGWAVTVTVRK